MTHPRDIYGRLSFRGRLLALLVAVALVQGMVAGFVFFQLQSKPADQRVQAQLEASLRGVAPVVDAQLEGSRERLAELVSDPALKPAVEAEDWATVTSILATPSAEDPASIIEDAASGSLAATDALDPSSQPADAPTAFITDPSGTVVAGARPDVPMLEQEGATTTNLTRGAELLAIVHVPVTFDAATMSDVIGDYTVEGIDAFVADDEFLATSNGTVETRPAGLASGVDEVEIDGEQQVALAEPVLGGDVLVGAMQPAGEVAAAKRDGMSSLWGFIVLLVALMLGVAWFVSRAVGDALGRFADVAQDLSGGQLHRRIPVHGDDEIAVLSSSFNEMAENLEQRIENLVEARAKLRRQVDLFGEALANATAVDEMLQAVCSLAMESSHATHARFWTIDDEGHFEHAACVGLRPSDTEPCGLEKAVPVRNESLQGSSEPYWLVVPARSGEGQIVGLLTLVSTRRAFAADDVRVAERIAVQAAVAIDNARMHEQLKLQATRDGLTGLPNHRSLQDELARRLEEAYASDMPLGVCLLDIDNFKRVNDTYGHQVGDEAIKAIGTTLSHGVGGMGMVGRYGGEEFVVIMPGCDADASCRIADRLREDITYIEVPLDDGGVLRVTSSFGVANLDQQDAGTTVDNTQLLTQADTGLYNAKRTGKNKVYLAGPHTEVIEMSEAEKAKLAAREAGDVAAEQEAAAALETNAPAAASNDPFDLAA